MKSFKNKVIWIIGASSGYGEALAKNLSEQGAKLIISARREEQLKKLAEKCTNMEILRLDLEQPDTFNDITQQAIAVYDHLDIVIFAGAIAQNSPALETLEQVSQKIMQIDYTSYTQLTQLIAPHFISQKSGHFVVISGLLAQIHLPGRSTYAAAKAALLGYFGCLRLELLPHNIDVTIIIPGSLQTDLASKAIQANGDVSSKPVAQTGCSVDEAAQQTVEKIAQRVYQSFIGKKDKSYLLWKISQFAPNFGIKTLIKQLSKRQ